MKNKNDLLKLLEEFDSTSKLYLEKFGNFSLDNIFLFDPLGCENYPEEISEGISILEHAIKTNKTLDDRYYYPSNVIF